MENILEIKNLRKKYKQFTLKDISLELPRGYIMGLIGPNGAGKSTTIKLIMNMIKSDGGEIKVFGLDNKIHEEEIKSRIGYIGEEQYFYEDMTVSWTEKFVSRYYKNWESEKFYSLLERFDISKTKKIKELSKGMKVKLALALVLSHNPELLILDEPTSGLDPVVRRDILNVLLDVIQDEKKSILISSHITEDIDKIADYVTYMIDGKIVLSDEKEKILSNWKKVHISKEHINDNIKKHLMVVQENIFGITGITNNYSGILKELGENKESNGIKFESATLDDILVSYVKEGKIC
ncbi:ABC transporter ATP-binding protein [Caloranaerobacter ferrireducens]|uniref:ABC transporter ATP-binding protein n=1 Tax=Caloranaerobacter ferrireducens TaxID=1323370 RepID=UPI00084CF447|nr:ABC transporter ATP-binding protein [Caloranaerobacter ferrireducens]